MEWTETYDIVVEFPAARSAVLAIFVIGGCTPSAQYDRREFPRDDAGRAQPGAAIVLGAAIAIAPECADGVRPHSFHLHRLAPTQPRAWACLARCGRGGHGVRDRGLVQPARHHSALWRVRHSFLDGADCGL